jgi:hypothetical protein
MALEWVADGGKGLWEPDGASYYGDELVITQSSAGTGNRSSRSWTGTPCSLVAVRTAKCRCSN